MLETFTDSSTMTGSAIWDATSVNTRALDRIEKLAICAMMSFPWMEVRSDELLSFTGVQTPLQFTLAPGGVNRVARVTRPNIGYTSSQCMKFNQMYRLGQPKKVFIFTEIKLFGLTYPINMYLHLKSYSFLLWYNALVQDLPDGSLHLRFFVGR